MWTLQLEKNDFCWPGWLRHNYLVLRRFPCLLNILMRNISSDSSSPPNSCQYVCTIPEKSCMLLTFQKWTFCKGLQRENDGPSIQGKLGQETYTQNYNQIRAYAECFPNQLKKLYLIDLSIEQSTKLWRFLESADHFCFWNSAVYCILALPTHAYKMVITSVHVCVQIDKLV